MRMKIEKLVETKSTSTSTKESWPLVETKTQVL